VTLASGARGSKQRFDTCHKQHLRGEGDSLELRRADTGRVELGPAERDALLLSLHQRAVGPELHAGPLVQRVAKLPPVQNLPPVKE
jgi:hypothetical protein